MYITLPGAAFGEGSKHKGFKSVSGTSVCMKTKALGQGGLWKGLGLRSKFEF